MAIVLIATLIVFFLTQSAPALARWRDYAWLRSWQEQVGRAGGDAPGLLLVVGVPVLLCALVQAALHGRLLSIVALAFATVVLFYCWGPRDLERDAEAVDKAPDSDQRLAAAQALRGDEVRQPLPLDAAALVEATFIAALRYRLVQLVAFAPAHAEALTAPQRVLAERAAHVLDWLPAHLMALALALASNFDAVFKTWHDYHAARADGWFNLDPGFLNAIARASVAADVAAEDDAAHAARNPLVALDDAMVLVRRVLVVWLTIIAVIVLAGWFA